MKTTKLLFAALTAMTLLTTACGKNNSGGDAAASVPGGDVAAACSNCTGFVAGPTAFAGNVVNGAFRIDNLTVVSDQNSLATAGGSKISGTYQGMVTGGTFTSSGSSCVMDGTYQISGLQVGLISQNLGTESSNPMWVTLTGPMTYKAPVYIKLADTNGDDIG